MNRLFCLMAAALSIFSVGSPSAAQEAEPQWIYRQVDGEGPVATFLDWRYGSVLFRISCDRNDLLVQYEQRHAEPQFDPMELLFDGEPTPLATTVDSESERRILEGRVAATSALVLAADAADNIDIEAPNEMGEPWYLGRAEALRRVIRACAQN